MQMDKGKRCRRKSSIIPTNDKIIEFNNKESLSTIIDYSGMSFIQYKHYVHDKIHNYLLCIIFKKKISYSR